MKILVIGGTGNVGSEVVKQLLSRNANVRIMTSSPDKIPKLSSGVEGVVGNVRDVDSLKAAMKNVDGVFFVTPFSEHEDRDGTNVVNAAKDAGVRRIVYASVHRLEDIPEAPHFSQKITVENVIKESGMEYTLLRPSNFFQNDLWLKMPIMDYGIYPQPIGNKGLHRVDVRDIALAAAIALLKDEFTGKTFALVGPDLMTGENTAKVYGKHLGKEVVYAGDDLVKWSAQMKGMLPDWLIEDFRLMYLNFQKNGLIATSEHHAETERILGRKPILFDTFAKELVERWKNESTVGVAAKASS